MATSSQAQNGDIATNPDLSRLMTADRSTLLNVIDQLRSLGVNKWIELPSIVVCGNQSSGKSSVLEAISRLSFPQGEGVCTTFATELSLRRALESAVSVEIQPANSRDDEERKRISSFKAPSRSIDDFRAMVASAKEFLTREYSTSQDSIFEDTLRVNVSSPNMPPLTLVDLPGIIHHPNHNQSEEDVERINRVVRSYMANPKSIVLVVLSAESDPPTQKVLKLAREVDPTGERTLGVITKPDTLYRGSDSEQDFVKYANNEHVKFQLGWHVVVNRSFETRDRTLEGRDEDEDKFFATRDIWTNVLGQENLGIKNLRERLSLLLENHTRALLPGVITSIKELLTKCDLDLERLGDSRETPEEKRRFLTSISENFQRIIEQSVEGNYQDAFFSNHDQYEPRCLRADLQKKNDAFAFIMHTAGHSREVQGQSCRYPGTTPPFPPPYFSMRKLPEVVDRNKYLSIIQESMREARAKELPGVFNYQVIRDLFRFQCKKWEDIVSAHVEEVWLSASQNLFLVASHVANKNTAQALLKIIIDEKMDKKMDRMRQTLKDLMHPYLHSHPITYDPSFLQRVEEIRNSSNSTSEERDNDSKTASNALDFMNAYYEVALCRLIDNVAVLVVEMCLLEDLPKVFTPGEVSMMDTETLMVLASEPDSLRRERIRLQKKREDLRTALKTCIQNAARATPERNTNMSALTLIPLVEEKSNKNAFSKGPNDEPFVFRPKNSGDSKGTLFQFPTTGVFGSLATQTSLDTKSSTTVESQSNGGMFGFPSNGTPTKPVESPFGFAAIKPSSNATPSNTTKSYSGGGLFGDRTPADSKTSPPNLFGQLVSPANDSGGSAKKSRHSGKPSFVPYTEKNPAIGREINEHQSINSRSLYQGWSFEELRLGEQSMLNREEVSSSRRVLDEVYKELSQPEKNKAFPDEPWYIGPLRQIMRGEDPFFVF